MPNRVLLLCIFLSGLLQAQDKLVFEDQVYKDYIKTVRFHLPGLYTSYPIIQLGSNRGIMLSFDDLEADAKYYYYTVIHCDADWTPSELDVFEYIDGFEEEEIQNFAYSINTTIPFVHHWVEVPNPNFRLTKSGNYLLVVYLDRDPENVVITRRFVVVEPKITIDARMVNPAVVSKNKTHQEIDFSINTQQLRVLNPREEIKVTVLQNWRWDHAITDLWPRFERGQILDYNHQDKVVFLAGQDFRNLDMRSLRYRSEDVMRVEQHPDITRVVAEIDEPRLGKNYFLDRDLNGQFVTLTADNFDRVDTMFYRNVFFGDSTYRVPVLENEGMNEFLEADYAEVLFTLRMPQIQGQEVFIYGGLTDWKLKRAFRMDYDERLSAYTAKVMLKQGFYDYIYVVSDGDRPVDEYFIEGSWYEAENTYTFLVYYSPLGARYDRLVLAYTLSSGN